METGLSPLEKWYRARCDGNWEHSWGVNIGTLDNPGWSIAIDLNETSAEARNLDIVKIERKEDDWIFYWVEQKKFQIRCGPLNLSESVHRFVDWFES